MELTIRNVHHFLHGKGLIDPAGLFNANYYVEKLPTNSPIFHVHDGSRHLCLKQVDHRSEWSVQLMPRYVTAIRIVNGYNEYKTLRKHIPKFIEFDTYNDVLISSFAQDYENLDQLYVRNKNIDQDILCMITDIVYSIGIEIEKIKDTHGLLHSLPCKLPWIIDLLSDSDYTSDLAARHNTIVYECIQNNSLREIILKSKESWNPISLIHGDIKWSNFLIKFSKNKKVKLLLTDWETADIGDPLWDLAGILQNVICNKILENEHLLLKGYSDYDLKEELTETMPKIIEITRRYYKPFPSHSDNKNFVKILIYTSARLIQTASEANQYANYIKGNARKILLASEFIYQHRKHFAQLIQ